jgi:hypothetical protein
MFNKKIFSNKLMQLRVSVFADGENYVANRKKFK